MSEETVPVYRWFKHDDGFKRVRIDNIRHCYITQDRSDRWMICVVRNDEPSFVEALGSGNAEIAGFFSTQADARNAMEIVWSHLDLDAPVIE